MMRTATNILAPLTALALVLSCGGSKGTSGGNGDAAAPDGMPSSSGEGSGSGGSSGSSPAGPGSSGGSMSVDGGAETGSGNGDAGPGSGTLTGPLAFPVRWTWMVPTQPASECGADAVATGGYAATAIALFEDDEYSLACLADAGLGSNNGATGRFILVEVATLQYVQETTTMTNPPPPTQALTPGVYTIVNEGENDENLCSFPVSMPAAVLEVEQFGLYDAQEIAISGTVTIDSVSAQSIVGSFNVLLGGPYGQTDGGPGQPLSGTFNAATCP